MRFCIITYECHVFISEISRFKFGFFQIFLARKEVRSRTEGKANKGACACGNPGKMDRFSRELPEPTMSWNQRNRGEKAPLCVCSSYGTEKNFPRSSRRKAIRRNSFDRSGRKLSTANSRLFTINRIYCFVNVLNLPNELTLAVTLVGMSWTAKHGKKGTFDFSFFFRFSFFFLSFASVNQIRSTPPGSDFVFLPFFFFSWSVFLVVISSSANVSKVWPWFESNFEWSFISESLRSIFLNFTTGSINEKFS